MRGVNYKDFVQTLQCMIKVTDSAIVFPVREGRPDPEVGRPEVSRRDGDGLDGARVEGEAVEDDERHRDELDGRRGGRQRGGHVAEDGVAVG